MKHQILSKAISFSLAASLALAPGAAFAKDGGSNVHVDGHAKIGVKVEKHDDTPAPASCMKAFGHLIAPGWIKLNGTTTIDSACPVPFGIAKKLGGVFHVGTSTHEHATSTPDTTAPNFFGIMSSTGTSTATITWFTNERSTSQVAYGTTTAYGSTSSLNSNLTFFHSVKLTELDPATTYHFDVMSRDNSGNLGTSADRSFVTKSVADTIAPVISAVATTFVGSTSAVVSWTTNEPSTSKVYFASGSSLDLNTASTSTSDVLVTNHSLGLSGLSASTTYSFAVRSADASGNTSTSATNSFVTGL